MRFYALRVRWMQLQQLASITGDEARLEHVHATGHAVRSREDQGQPSLGQHLIFSEAWHHLVARFLILHSSH